LNPAAVECHPCTPPRISSSQQPILAWPSRNYPPPCPPLEHQKALSFVGRARGRHDAGMAPKHPPCEPKLGSTYCEPRFVLKLNDPHPNIHKVSDIPETFLPGLPASQLPTFPLGAPLREWGYLSTTIAGGELGAQEPPAATRGGAWDSPDALGAPRHLRKLPSPWGPQQWL
jgi:hypothetical protein